MVTRCLCQNVRFTEIAELARAGLTFEQIQSKTGCCTGCGMCEPYVRLVIDTRAERLPILSVEECDRIMKQAAAHLAMTGPKADLPKPPGP